jgi:hypothetical protein
LDLSDDHGLTIFTYASTTLIRRARPTKADVERDMQSA